MALKCPKCGRDSVDFDAALKVYKCFWFNCNFQMKSDKNNKHELVISI